MLREVIQSASSFVAFFFLFSASLSAENSSSSLPLLSKIHKAYTSSPSFTFTFSQTYTPAGFAATSPETGRLTLQAPDQLRFDYAGAEGKLFAFDGKAALQYVAADKQLVVKSLTPEDRVRLPLLFLDAPDKTLTRYTATAKKRPDGSAEITLVPTAGGEPRRLVLDVTETGEVVRLAVTDTSGNETAFTFKEKKAGRTLPVSTFTFVPPPGTKIISD
jgi:outer membrane lipoprotein carrier protein